MKNLEIFVSEKSQNIMLLDTCFNKVVYNQQYRIEYKEDTLNFVKLLCNALMQTGKLSLLCAKLDVFSIKYTFSESNFGEVMIGISDKNTYHWFLFDEYMQCFFFRQSYNMANGKANKGMKKGFAVKERYNAIFGEQIL